MNMFFRSFSSRQKTVLILLFLPTVGIIGFVFWNISAWSGQNWKLVTLALAIPFFYYFQKNSTKFTRQVIDRVFGSGPSEIFDEGFRCIEGVRVIRVYLFLKERGSLKKDKIEHIISSLKFEASVPKYRFFSGKLFYTFFILFIGIVIPKLFELITPIKPEEKFDSVMDILSVVAKAMGLVVMLVFLTEWMVKDTHNRLSKNHYKVNLIRYLEEIRMLIV